LYRFRRGEIPDSREARTGKKSALENAMRQCRDRFSDAVVEPEIGMEFDSLPEAYDFYNIYSWEIGFGIRYGSSRINPAKSKIRQDITCGCEVSPNSYCHVPKLLQFLFVNCIFVATIILFNDDKLYHMNRGNLGARTQDPLAAAAKP
jgi:hypothetical protein